MTPALDPLATRWRTEAALYERDHALVDGSGQLRRVADELEAALREHEQVTLTLKEAAEESGYSEEHLRRLVGSGSLPAQRNGCKRSHIRVRRSDLPRKPLRRAQGRKNGAERYNVDKDARDIANRLGGFSA